MHHGTLYFFPCPQVHMNTNIFVTITVACFSEVNYEKKCNMINNDSKTLGLELSNLLGQVTQLGQVSDKSVSKGFLRTLLALGKGKIVESIGTWKQTQGVFNSTFTCQFFNGRFLFYISR